MSREAELGRAVFRIYCAPCHGRNAEGGRAPDLTRGQFNAGERDEDLARVIGEGVRGTDMIGFSDMISRENTERIVAYIRAVGQPPITISGDAAQGETIFWGKGACGTCHQVGSRGGNFGPDLTRIGRSRSAFHLREALVQPDAHISGGYSGVSVVTRDGKKLAGIEVGIDQFSVRLREPNGTYHSFLRSELTSATQLEKSLMPSYAGKLSDGELGSVVVYLMSL